MSSRAENGSGGNRKAMIEVRLIKNGERFLETHPTGEYAIPSDDGNWLYIYDDDGLTVGVYAREAVISARVKAGENVMTNVNIQRPG
jgi:hypothetical protein